MAWRSEFHSFPSVVLLLLVDETYTFVFGGVASPLPRSRREILLQGCKHAVSRWRPPPLRASSPASQLFHRRESSFQAVDHSFPPNKDPPPQAGRSPHQVWAPRDAKQLAFLLDFYKGSLQGAISGQTFPANQMLAEVPPSNSRLKRSRRASCFSEQMGVVVCFPRSICCFVPSVLGTSRWTRSRFQASILRREDARALGQAQAVICGLCHLDPSPPRTPDIPR